MPSRIPFMLRIGATRAGGSFSSTPPVDGDGPVIVSLSPADNDTNILVGVWPEITFDEPIGFDSTVSVTLKRTSDNSTVQAFTQADIGAGLLISGIGGNKLTIKPSTDLDTDEEFYILVDATSIKDFAGNFFAGIASTTDWSFTTEDGIAPVDGWSMKFNDGGNSGYVGTTIF